MKIASKIALALVSATALVDRPGMTEHSAARDIRAYHSPPAIFRHRREVPGVAFHVNGGA